MTRARGTIIKGNFKVGFNKRFDASLSLSLTLSLSLSLSRQLAVSKPTGRSGPSSATFCPNYKKKPEKTASRVGRENVRWRKRDAWK